MNLLLDIPLEIRLAGLFALGVCLGSLVNLGVYRLAWHPRAISPWSTPDPEAPPRRRSDRLPIVGWLGLRREAVLHGRAFWVRPLLVELICGIGLAALYWWEVGREGLLLPGVPAPGPAVLHAQFASHLILIALMLVGSLIDVDEKIIPDTITVPGTWVALLAAAICPWSLLPDVVQLPTEGLLLGNMLGLHPVAMEYDFVRLTSPNAWPGWLGGSPRLLPLVIGLTCWWLWCVALMERTWHSRYGWRRAWRYFVAGLIRRPSTRPICAMGLAGSAGIGAVWLLAGPRWAGLLTALVGMAAAGGLVWLVRVIGTVALQKEAMGFGDVTLMAMIGAFLGWQACLIVFFLAPFAGLVVGVPNRILRRDKEIPYGPFLCLATLVLIVRWAPLWDWAEPIFGLGRWVPVVILICLALMAGMLAVWRLVLAVVHSLRRGSKGL